MISRPSTFGFALAATCAITWTAITLSASPVRAEALILVEADTGKVLAAENATQPWYPASITKIMTSYVTLRAVKEGRITLDKLLTVHDTVPFAPFINQTTAAAAGSSSGR